MIKSIDVVSAATMIGALYAVGGPEIAVFKNSKGETIFYVGGVQNSVEHYSPCQPIGCEGLILDDTASSLEIADYLIVHLA